MDAYAPLLMRARPQGDDRQGPAHRRVKQAMRDEIAVYFAATGGAGALLARRIVGNEVIAWPELGAEAVARLEVEDFPAIVVNDCHGGDLYEEGRAAYVGPASGGPAEHHAMAARPRGRLLRGAGRLALHHDAANRSCRLRSCAQQVESLHGGSR